MQERQPSSQSILLKQPCWPCQTTPTLLSETVEAPLLLLLDYGQMLWQRHTCDKHISCLEWNKDKDKQPSLFLLSRWPRLMFKIKHYFRRTTLLTFSFLSFLFFSSFFSLNSSGVYFNLITLFREQGFTDTLRCVGDCVPLLRTGGLRSLRNGSFLCVKPFRSA